MKFQATHAIKSRNRLLLVMLFEGGFYTRQEWQTETACDFSLGEGGELLFQGEVVASELQELPSKGALEQAIFHTRYGMKSFDGEEIAQSLIDGHPITRLNSGDAGEDDLLVGDEDECLGDVLYHFEIEELPSGWTLKEVTEELVEAARLYEE